MYEPGELNWKNKPSLSTIYKEKAPFLKLLSLSPVEWRKFCRCRSIMYRTSFGNLFLAWLFVPLMLMTSLASGSEEASSGTFPEDLELSQRAEQLVEDLGHSQFSRREQAADELKKLGLAARDALKSARRHPDAEIRFRSRRIFAIIQETDFLVRLEAFAKDLDGINSLSLPGWDRFQQAVGSSHDARALFVEMQRAEPELLEASEADSKRAAELFGERCRKLYSARLPNGSRVEVPSSSVAALLFVAGTNDRAISLDSSSVLGYLCTQAAFQRSMSKQDRRELLKELMAHWFQHEQSRPTYQTLSLAMRYEVSQGVILANRLLADEQQKPVLKQYAILTIAKLGDESQVPVLVKMLDDKSVCMTRRISRNKKQVTFTTEVRDVALAALLKIKKLDPKSHGFPNIQTNSIMVFSPSTIGFSEVEDRAAAFANWEKLSSIE